jgi:hypothetical protein
MGVGRDPSHTETLREVAFKPDQVYLSGSNNHNLDDQLDMLSRYEANMRSELGSDIGVVLSSASIYAQLCLLDPRVRSCLERACEGGGYVASGDISKRWLFTVYHAVVGVDALRGVSILDWRHDLPSPRVWIAPILTPRS